MNPQALEYHPNPQPVADTAKPEAKTFKFTGKSSGSRDNLNRHNAATGAHQIATAETRDAMTESIRSALHGVTIPDETITEIEAARVELTETEALSTEAKEALEALDADHRTALEKLESLAAKPEPGDVDKVYAENLALEKQSALIEIIAGRLSDARSKSHDARIAANAAKASLTKLETTAARAFALSAMPAPRGPLVDLHAAAAAWALDRSMHPEKQNFPSCSLGEFLDHHFTETEALALVEIARAEISQVIRGQ